MPAYAQGSTVSFDGAPLGSLRSFTVDPATAQSSDATGMAADIFGSGADTRLVKQVDCTTIDPGTVSVRLLGCPPYAVADIGSKGTLAVAFDGGSISWEAILVRFNVEGSVGDLLTGSAEFQFTGG